eukprot:RCo033154
MERPFSASAPPPRRYGQPGDGKVRLSELQTAAARLFQRISAVTAGDSSTGRVFPVDVTRAAYPAHPDHRHSRQHERRVEGPSLAGGRSGAQPTLEAWGSPVASAERPSRLRDRLRDSALGPAPYETLRIDSTGQSSPVVPGRVATLQSLVVEQRKQRRRQRQLFSLLEQAIGTRCVTADGRSSAVAEPCPCPPMHHSPPQSRPVGIPSAPLGRSSRELCAITSASPRDWDSPLGSARSSGAPSVATQDLASRVEQLHRAVDSEQSR